MLKIGTNSLTIVSSLLEYIENKVNKMIYISFRRPEVLKITAKMGVGFDIYVWKPAYATDR